MHKHLWACLLASTTLGACSFLPKIATPDGHNRRPANTQAALDQYTSSLAPPQPAPALPPASPELAEVKHDLSLLKQQVAALIAERDAVAKAGAAPTVRKRPRFKRPAHQLTERTPKPVSMVKPTTPATGSNHRENAR